MSAVRFLPVLLSLSLGSASLSAAFAAEPPLPADPRKRLEALQHALIDAAMASQTRVRSAAWVDNSGQLHENTRITSDMKVRGVRLIPDKQNEGGMATAILADSSRATPNDEACRATDLRYRREATLETAMRIASVGTERYDWTMLLSQVRTRFVAQTAASRKWVLSQPARVPEQTYERLLTGVQPDLMPYQMLLELLPPGALGIEPVRLARDKASGAARATKAVLDYFNDEPPRRDPIPFVLRLSVIERSSQVLMWQETAPLFYPESEIKTTSQPLPPGLLSELDRVLHTWQDKLDHSFSCKPQQFNVLQENKEGWTINGGQTAGLSIGDQLLLINREHLPARILEADSGQHMALVEVVGVKSGSAIIRKLAGPKDMSRSGDWVATPF